MTSVQNVANRTVAIVAFGMDHCMRGVEANAQMLFDKLGQEEGYEVHLVKGSGLSNRNEHVLSVPKRDSILCRTLGRLRGYNIYWEQVFFMLRLGMHLIGKGRKYDVIYTQEYVHLIGMGKVKKWFGLDFRLIYCEGFVISRPTRLKYADVLQEINRKNYDELSTAAEEQGVSMQLLPHFYEAEVGELSIEEQGVSPSVSAFKAERTMLMFVGSTERPEKNFELLLTDFALLSDDYCMLICGECPPSRLIELREEFPGRIHHLYVRHIVMQEVYPLADFFVLPALNEPFGISIIEAMYFARPVILHNTAHSRWVCGDETQCIDMQEKGSLVSHLSSIPSIEEYVAEKGQENRKYFDEHYTWGTLRDRYLELFNS